MKPEHIWGKRCSVCIPHLLPQKCNMCLKKLNPAAVFIATDLPLWGNGNYKIMKWNRESSSHQVIHLWTPTQLLTPITPRLSHTHTHLKQVANEWAVTECWHPRLWHPSWLEDIKSEIMMTCSLLCIGVRHHGERPGSFRCPQVLSFVSCFFMLNKTGMNYRCCLHGVRPKRGF